jgi:hypothetical protein
MFCICFIIIIDHIFVDIRFYSLGQVGSGEQFVTTERPSSVSSPLFSIFSLVAILVGSRDHRTQFWKGAIQGLFHQSLVAIGPGF